MNKLAATERRRFIRHPLCFPLAYKVIEKDSGQAAKEAKSTTKNISVGGLLFAAKNPVSKGAVIMIKIPFENRLFNVRAKVVYCRKDPETKLHDIGVSFYRINDAFKVKLIEQIYLISEYRDLRSMQLGREVSLEEASKDWIKRYSRRFSRLYW